MKQPKVKRKRGRPVTSGPTPMIGLRLDPLVTAKVDAYAEKYHLHTRSDAIRVMIDRVLACEDSAS